MLLVKCKCGCLFTLKDEAPLENTTGRNFICQNCNEGITLSSNTNISDLHNTAPAPISSVYKLPNSVEITFSFIETISSNNTIDDNPAKK
ncbi:MAG: hypothetical protein FWG88_05180 [Oscillospiraceae bacterium]|nr:hypothetical protein [Oscillospiraceae bacterium]